MIPRGFIILSLSIIIVLQSCLQCTTGGQLNIKENYVANVCGLVNGVSIKEIKVDSFKNNIPTKYSTVRSAS
jgi:hypothetical protein